MIDFACLFRIRECGDNTNSWPPTQGHVRDESRQLAATLEREQPVQFGCNGDATGGCSRPMSSLLRDSGTMQIAGSKCSVCGGDIVLSKEGKFCSKCGRCMHLVCEPLEDCSICGGTLRLEAPPDADPLRDAILPRALRPAKGGPLMVALLSLVAAVLFLIIYYAIMDALAHGH